MKEDIVHPTKRRVAIYARVSSSKQTDEATIESQISVLLEYSRKNDLHVPEGWIFQDNGVSGSTIQRPALDRLRDLVASGSPDLVLIYHPDRLARKYVYQAVILEEFVKNGVEVVFFKNKKAETPEDHLLEQFQGMFAEYERAQIAERCRRGRLHKAKQGLVSVIPNAPFGYRYIRDQTSGIARYEVYPEEAAIITKLFQMYGVENCNFSELLTFLTNTGLQPRKSKLGWDKQTIRRILKNRAYTGLASFGKTEKSEGDSNRIVRTKSGPVRISKWARKDCLEEDWLGIAVPSIITDQLYRMVQDKLKESQRFSARNTRQPSILQGILVCGSCGSSYYKKARRSARTYYCCHRNLHKSEQRCNNRSIRQIELDEYIWSWISALLRDPALIEAEIRRRTAEDPDAAQIAEKRLSLIRDRNKITNSRNKLIDAYSTGDCLSLDELKKRMQILNQTDKQIERELAVMDTQTADEERIRHSRMTLQMFSKALANSSNNLTIEDKQKVVRALVHEIVVFEDSITIKHCIPMASDEKSSQHKCPLKTQRSATAIAVNTKGYPQVRVACLDQTAYS